MKAKKLIFCLVVGCLLFAPKGGFALQDPEEVLQEAYNRGIENWWGRALLLLEEGKGMGGERGLRVVEFSSRLAPDLPSVHIEAALCRWRLRPWELLTPLRGYWEAVKGLLRNPPLLVRAGVEVIFYLSRAALLATAILALILIVKKMPLLFFQTSWGGRAARLVLLGIPLLLRLSLPWVLLLWGISLWPYLSGRAKGALLVGLIALTYLVPLPGEVSGRLAEGPAELLADLYDMNHGPRGDGVWRRLRLREQEGFDRDLYLSLAVGYKREGRYREAERRLRAILLRASTDADAWCNLGNVLLLQGRVEEAVRAYRRAISYRSDEGIYYYNLSKALMQQSIFFLPEASAAFKRAAELAPHRVALQLQRESPHPNRSLLDAPLRRGEILWRGLGELVGRGEGFLWRAWLTGLSPRAPYVQPLTILALMALLGILPLRSSHRRCAMCGRLFSGLYSQREEAKTICLRCATVIRGRERDLPAREETLRRVKAFMRRETRIVRVLQHLPGLAHLWQGHYLSGWAFLTLALTALVGVLYPHGVLPHPYLVVPGFPATVPLWVVVLLVLYWVAGKDALRRGHGELLRPPFYMGV